MRKFLQLALVLAGALLFSVSAHAQNFITVTATVTDPNGIPYAGGTMSAVLVPGSPGGWTLGGQPYSGRVGPIGLDSTGSFTANFGSNAAILPASSQWEITINSNPGGIAPPLGTGAQSFTVTMTISGPSPQSITSTLTAAAPKLTNFAGAGGGVTACTTPGGLAYENGTANILTCAGTLAYVAPTIFEGTPFASLDSGVQTFIGGVGLTNYYNAIVAANSGNPVPTAMEGIAQGDGAIGGYFFGGIPTGTPSNGVLGVQANAYMLATANTPFAAAGEYSQGVQETGTGVQSGGAAGIQGTALNRGQGTIANSLTPGFPGLFSFVSVGNINAATAAGAVPDDVGFGCTANMRSSLLLGGGSDATINACVYAVDQGTSASSYAEYFAGGKSHLDVVQGNTYNTLANCSGVGTAANPSVASCSAAAAGSFSCATNASTGTCVVNTTRVTANSQIFVQEDDSLGTKLGVTCNTNNVLPASAPLLGARSAGTSFTINLGTFATNPLCFSYFIVN